MAADSGKWFVIVNPVAGSGRGLDHFPQISKHLRDAHILCEPVFTEHKFHATELTVTAVREGYRRIIVVGGDGTLHEVVNGLFIQQEVCPDEVLVAVVAVGTGNDWVRTFGISNRYQDAVKAISEGYSFLQDVGVVSYEEAHYRQSRYMANVAGAGFDAHVVRKLSHLKKKGHRSRWRYTWCLVKNFFRYKSTGVKVWVADRLVYTTLLLSAAVGICKFTGSRGKSGSNDASAEVVGKLRKIFADNGVVVDMLSQSAPHGTTIDFSFTASSSDLPLVMKAISAADLDKDAKASPLISVGYSKLNLIGEEMVTSCGVAARALNALAIAGIEVLLVTTSDLDISLLVHAENEDAAYEALKKAYEL